MNISQSAAVLSNSSFSQNSFVTLKNNTPLFKKNMISVIPYKIVSPEETIKLIKKLSLFCQYLLTQKGILHCFEVFMGIVMKLHVFFLLIFRLD